MIEVLKNKSFEDADFNTKFIENNLSFFTEKKEINLKRQKSKKVKIKNKNNSDKDVKAFENIISNTPKEKWSKLYRKRFKSI